MDEDWTEDNAKLFEGSKTIGSNWFPIKLSGPIELHPDWGKGIFSKPDKILFVMFRELLVVFVDSIGDGKTVNY